MGIGLYVCKNQYVIAVRMLDWEWGDEDADSYSTMKLSMWPWAILV